MSKQYFNKATPSKFFANVIQDISCRSDIIPYCNIFCETGVECYLDAVLKEIQLYGKSLEDLDLRIVEIHVGSETPSLTPPVFYKRLQEKLEEFFDVRAGTGIEVNPEDFQSLQLVEEYYACSVEGASIGAQSFSDKVLESIGRRHRSEQNIKTIENSLKTGFTLINVDLMFLTPSTKGYVELKLEEKLGAFKRDLETAKELEVHQIT